MSAEERTLSVSRLTSSRRHPLLWLCRMLALDSKIEISVTDGAPVEPGPGDKPRLQVSHPNRMLARLLSRGDLGFAESYMAGEWSSGDLTALLAAIGANDSGSAVRKGVMMERMRDRLLHLLRNNSKAGSRRNIAYHYDLSNDFYALWLDPGMTYSSAVFGQAGEPLELAQQRKYRRLLDALQARPGDHILEIGCGWGGFAEEAARRGCRVTGVTLSREQLDFARNRIHAAGLGDLVTLEFRDYRDITGQYDHIVSIEMFEAVGEQYWGGYFETIRQTLRPGGRAALQIITIDDRAFDNYRNKVDFIQKYIFPGGMLPSLQRLERLTQTAGLEIQALALHGLDYARTLRAWHQAFDRQREAIAALGFDERFRRMWKYYLSYCEAGFRLGRIDLAQLTLSYART
jgi:cyclopropane-fatty-acyl-phospholipid synthase